MEEAITHLTRSEGPAGYWVHFDADALDESIMRAVDDPRAGRPLMARCARRYPARDKLAEGAGTTGHDLQP